MRSGKISLAASAIRGEGRLVMVMMPCLPWVRDFLSRIQQGSWIIYTGLSSIYLLCDIRRNLDIHLSSSQLILPLSIPIVIIPSYPLHIYPIIPPSLSFHPFPYSPRPSSHFLLNSWVVSFALIHHPSTYIYKQPSTQAKNPQNGTPQNPSRVLPRDLR